MGNCWPIFRIMASCSPIDSVRALMDAIETIREIYQKIDPVEHIDSFIGSIENQLHKMNRPSEAESSSSEGWLETVRDGTKLAAKTIDTISAEAERHSNKDAVEAMASLIVKVLKGMEGNHWVLIGLSIAVFTVESFTSFDCTHNKCRELLLKIIELAKDVDHYTKMAV